jgi:hypothetical protein
VISPLLANLYLHYVLDQWVAEWRRKNAFGDVIIAGTRTTLCLGFNTGRKPSGFWSNCGSGWRTTGWNYTRTRRA